MSTKKEIKLNQKTIDHGNILMDGATVDEAGSININAEKVAEVTNIFCTEEEIKHVAQGRDALIAATGYVVKELCGDFFDKNENVDNVTATVKFGNDTVGHTVNREGKMNSEYEARGINGAELKKVYKLLAAERAKE